MVARGAFDEVELIRLWILHDFEIVGEACRGLSDAFRDAHPDDIWSDAVSCRNLLIHQYFGIDLEAVPGWRQQQERTIFTVLVAACSLHSAPPRRFKIFWPHVYGLVHRMKVATLSLCTGPEGSLSRTGTVGVPGGSPEGLRRSGKRIAALAGGGGIFCWLTLSGPEIL